MAETKTAVILARGLGSRMQRADAGASLDARQEAAASLGLKSLIPDARGRPFLAHILSGLADVGIERVVLVVAPLHDPIADFLTTSPPARIRVDRAIQPEADGTAHALLAAAPLVREDSFLVLNADNLYPPLALQQLVALGGPGLIGFDRAGLMEGGGIDEERVRAFALLAVDARGSLVRIVEKPTPLEYAAMPDAPISMNLWRFDHRIFEACQAVERSPRGEFELPSAVDWARRHGTQFQVVPVRAPVLDLSQRGDIARVAAQLANQSIHP